LTLSLTELERAAAILRREISGHRIQAVAQPDATSVVLELYGGREGAEGGRRWLRLDASAVGAHVSELAAAPGGSPGSPRFVAYLRAHVRGARIRGVELLDGERQLALRLRGKDGDTTVLLAIFGRRSNLVVLDEGGAVAMTLRPLADTRPELEMGGPWQPPGRALPQRGEDRFAEVADADYLAAIERAYAERTRADAEGDTRRRVETALRKEAKGLDRKLEKLARELANAEKASRLEREGELLKSALDRVKRGDAEVTVQDFESGEDVTIALDPKLGPAENLERLFQRYRKGVRALTKAGAQHAAVQEARDELTALERDLAETADAGALDAFAARADVARVVKKYAPGPAPVAKDRPERRETKLAGRVVPAKYLPRRYKTAGDLEIWVGRSDAANDYLSTRLARGKDLFFHVAATPGSHVVLRTEGRSDPPSEAILDACELAAHYSKAKKATRVDVHVVPIANVRKPKGAKPGLVEVHGGRNLHLRREEARLRRVLDAKIED